MKGDAKRRAYGTTEIARLCQVSPPTIVRWIQEGKMPFFTTGGGHRRVWGSDLAAFFMAHNIPVPAELAAEGKFSALIVDDQPDMRSLMKLVIAEVYPGAEIHEAADGFEAGRKFADVLPSLVVLDVLLPGLNGLKVCRMIRADKALRSTRILVISGRNFEENRAESLKAGADDFLGKPFEVADLKERLRRLLPDRIVDA